RRPRPHTGERLRRPRQRAVVVPQRDAGAPLRSEQQPAVAEARRLHRRLRPEGEGLADAVGTPGDLGGRADRGPPVDPAGRTGDRRGPPDAGAARLVPPQARAAGRRPARAAPRRSRRPALRAAVDDPAAKRPGGEWRKRGLLLDLLQPHRADSDRAVPRSAPRGPDEPDGAVLRLEPSAPAPVA